MVRILRVKRPTGAEALVDEYCEFVDMSLRRTGTDYLPGPKRLALRTGGAINVIDELTLQDARSGEVLRVLEAVSPPDA